MKTCWFLVIRIGERWWVDCEGKAYGPFRDMEEATSNAIRFADIFGDAGRQSQVWAPDDTGRMRQVWAGNTPQRA